MACPPRRMLSLSASMRSSMFACVPFLPATRTCSRSLMMASSSPGATRHRAAIRCSAGEATAPTVCRSLWRDSRASVCASSQRATCTTALSPSPVRCSRGATTSGASSDMGRAIRGTCRGADATATRGSPFCPRVSRPSRASTWLASRLAASTRWRLRRMAHSMGGATIGTAASAPTAMRAWHPAPNVRRASSPTCEWTARVRGAGLKAKLFERAKATAPILQRRYRVVAAVRPLLFPPSWSQSESARNHHLAHFGT
mmetsp:Transcript_2546/g.7318  ORF Transcript_2546/g.7318 Transcript_2546/m.7318 type:complete len:257 (-) Transcript_2546:333-1103(-)